MNPESSSLAASWTIPGPVARMIMRSPLPISPVSQFRTSESPKRFLIGSLAGDDLEENFPFPLDPHDVIHGDFSFLKWNVDG